MEEKDYINQFKKSKQPVVPDGFFENFYSSIKDEIEAIDVFADFNIKKTKTVGAGARERESELKLRPIVVPKKKKTKIIRLTVLTIAASAAAVFAILFYTNLKSTETPIVNTPVVETNYDSYLAYMDESTLVDFIVENEVDMSTDIDEDIYDYVQDDLEDIYYDL